jgi:K(+)-stimulated pyrophosphate-energized sodium pump
MGADLFDSHVASLAAALVMAIALGGKNPALVFTFAGIGLLASIIGVLFSKMGKKDDPTMALNMGNYITTGIYAVLTGLATLLFEFEWRIWLATIIGLLVGSIIGLTTDYFTNDARKPVRNVAKASESGPAFTILSGVSYGFLSVLPAMIGIAVAALASYLICKPLGGDYPMFGVSMAAVGMLSIVGMIISNDAYGPIVDNARGLAEMGNLGEEVVDTTDKLDSAGNTVKAVTKGFSIGAAGLTVISLLFAFITEANAAATKLGKPVLSGFDILDPIVFFGIIIGAAVPAVFSSMLMLGVDKNAQRMVGEIHRQFLEIPGIMEGNSDPEYDKCIDIATKGALRELIPAGLFAIIITVLVGFIGGIKALGGFLLGNIVSGLLISLFMSNSGGLWDNGKKYIEAGNFGGKGSNAHKSAVVGDTVGDPFKDTAGPSINTQITVVSLLASLLVVAFISWNLIDVLF